MKKITSLFLLIITLMTQAFPQSSKNQSLGKITSHQLNGQILSLETDNGKAEVTVFNSGVIRIRITKDDFADDFSYAVIASPEKCPVKLDETTDQLIFSTPTLKLEIDKNPARFSFYTSDGRLINADDKAFGTSWIGTEITTYKKL
ncbi:MAG: DUF4968 domain-containing protein, partial [Lentimicrobium sp.]|nr:DUF4968 domain-containing protein [Lentimicrobium sp.]